MATAAREGITKIVLDKKDIIAPAGTIVKKETQEAVEVELKRNDRRRRRKTKVSRCVPYYYYVEKGR